NLRNHLSRYHYAKEPKSLVRFLVTAGLNGEAVQGVEPPGEGLASVLVALQENDVPLRALFKNNTGDLPAILAEIIDPALDVARRAVADQHKVFPFHLTGVLVRHLGPHGSGHEAPAR